MKSLSCLIVDDSELSVMVLQSYLKKVPFFSDVIACGSCTEAIEIMNTQKIDLLFLDIMLPDFSGMTLLRNTTSLPPTIVISSYIEYAVESYEIGKAIDYLQKPFSFERFMLAVNRVLSLEETIQEIPDNCIWLKKGRAFRRFDFDKILYVESYGIYSKVYTTDEMDAVNENISSLEEQLGKKHFARTHKSYIINLSKISEIGANYFEINNQVKIPIGRSYKPNFDSLLQMLDKIDEK